MRSDDGYVIGVLFGYINNDNYYRFSLVANRWQLIKKENGVMTTVRGETEDYTVGEPFTLTADAIGARLVGYLGDTRLFDRTNRERVRVTGQVGLYCASNAGSRFERVEVRRPPLEAYALFRDRFAVGDVTHWSAPIDARPEDGVQEGHSDWLSEDGAYRQRSNIWSLPNDRDTLSKKGTQVIAGDPAWNNVILSARLQSRDNDAIGLLFRYTDEDNYYRFSMDSQRAYRRLVKSVVGVFTSLWEDDFAYEVGRTYELTIIANEGTLRGYIDGVPMFVVEDGDLAGGQIGLYCWGNNDARFSNIRMYPEEQAFRDWLMDEAFDILIPGRWLPQQDEGDQEGPSQWELVDGELLQTSNIWGEKTDESTGKTVPADKPDTYVLAGEAA